MRTRTKDSRTGPSHVLQVRTSNAALPNEVMGNSPSAYVGLFQQMKDTNNSAIYFSGGKVVCTPCRRERRERKAQVNPQVVHTAPNWNGGTATAWISGDFAGWCQGALPQVVVNTQKQEGLSLVEAYAKMHESTTISGEALATMKQTIAMLRSPLEGLQKGIRRLFTAHERKKTRAHLKYTSRIQRIARIKKRKPRIWYERKEHALRIYNEAVSRSYLELRYGLFPLVWDVETHIDKVIEELHDQAMKQTEIRVARGNAFSETVRTSGSTATQLSYLSIVRDPKFSYECSTTRRGSAGVVYEVGLRSNADEVMAHLGLRLRDVPNTLWELIPLSFVVDWAMNVGRWLQAIVPVPGIQPITNWTTTIEERTSSVTSMTFHILLGWGTNHRKDCSFPGSSETVNVYERRVDSSLASHPVIIGKPLSNLRIGDALSLTAIKIADMIRKSKIK